MQALRLLLLSLLTVTLGRCVVGSHNRQPSGQNPSPMQEHTRRHVRLQEASLKAVSFDITGVLPKPVSVFVPPSVREAEPFDLLVHFHGAPFVVGTAVSLLDRPVVGIAVNLGSGSSVYERPFSGSSTFRDLVAAARDSLVARALASRGPRGVYLSAFSAGYGAVRAILRDGQEPVDGVLLLDGLHTDYVPHGVVLYEGGLLNTEKLDPFLDFARLAVDGDKRMVVTHSEIFPGTFASTTETTDYLIRELGLERRPVLEWGPGGMQLLSRTEAGRLTILGFAGNTAPDHIDHLHALPEFLRLLVDS